MFTKTGIEQYFLAERQAGLVFVIIGAVSIALALLFFFLLRGHFYKGAAMPLLLVGLIQLAAGFTVFKRSDDDRVRNVYAYDANPWQLKNVELPRMKKVNDNFVIYRWIEITLLLAAAAVLFYFRTRSSGRYWFGLGLTLAIQAAIMLGADYMAQQRALTYTKGLETVTSKL